MASISYFNEDVRFSIPFPRKTKHWISRAIVDHKKTLGELNFIFCSDNYLHQMNVQFLNHDTLTDIITFSNSEDKHVISGDIFISVHRVQENAANYKIDFNVELRRVIIHGVLHLLGYKDKSKAHKTVMSGKEDWYLSLWK